MRGSECDGAGSCPGELVFQQGRQMSNQTDVLPVSQVRWKGFVMKQERVAERWVLLVGVTGGA